MIFNSYIFLFIFFPITFAIFWLLKNKQHRYIWLTATGYIFYGYWNWKFSVLMLVTTAIDFFLALWIEKNSLNPSKKKLGVTISVISNLLILGFFKYFNFLADSFVGSAQLFGFTIPTPSINILLPIGISFYTFQAMSYTIDVYRGHIHATRNFFEYSTYIALFPQLIAGPIVRYATVMQDLDTIDKKPRNNFFFDGINLFVIGLVKKVLIADSIATIIDPLWNNAVDLDFASAWVAVLGYTYQLYFDFSGYSDMAIGLGRLFGFNFPQNFNSPYKAINISDFWQRWHISLSSWLRDYLYIPLGGSRRGNAHTYANLILTMLLGGLWHGANWTFVAWGSYHGLLLALNRFIKTKYDRIPIFLQRIVTFFLILVGWVFFRSPTFATAWLMLRHMFEISMSTSAMAVLISENLIKTITLLAIATFITQFMPNTFEIRFSPKVRYAIALATAFVVCVILINYKQTTFIYYQF